MFVCLFLFFVFFLFCCLDAVSPILQQTKYFFQIVEDIAGQSTIGSVAANKDSSAINSTFLYTSNPGELVFVFEVSTGALTNQQTPFDFESGELTTF